MALHASDSISSENNASAERLLMQVEKRLWQDMSRQCWLEGGPHHRANTRELHHLAEALGFPDLSLFDGSGEGSGGGSEAPHRRGSRSSHQKDAPTTSTETNKDDAPATTDAVGSSATTFGPSAMPEVSQEAPGFYVSPNGSADGDGSKENPFATLQQAQKAMENSDIKTTYVEGGTYKMGSTLKLTSADSGESFISIGGADNPAVLDGGGKLSNLISLDAADNVTIEGFAMQNTSNAPVWSEKHGQILPNVGAIYVQNSSGDTIAYNSMNNVNVGINMQGDSDLRIARNSITNAQSAIDSGPNGNKVYDSNITILGNLVQNITGYGGKLFNNVGAININGDTNVTIRNNVIENTAGVGIQMNYREAGSGFTVSDNTILNTDFLATTDKPDTSSNPVADDGSIHIITAPGSTKDLDGLISDNYIKDAGVSRADKCVYLDDGVNGVTVTGNVLEEGHAGYAVQIHGGDDNIIDNNTFILDSIGGGVMYQTDGYEMTGNVIENNNFIATGKGQKAYSFLNTDDSDMPIFSGNIYSPGLNESPDSSGSIS